MASAAALIAGAMNGIAGGGSFVSFPALVLVGVPPISANATNNAAMWVGTLGSARGFREEIAAQRAILLPIAAVSAVGAVLGALLLLVTPPTLFERMIPWLLLFATIVFTLSPWLVGRKPQTPRHSSWQFAVQFCVAVYGGYFGAGMGILMLAVLAFSGLPNINAANGVKNVLSVVINGVALVPFALARIVSWPYAVPMAVMALLGGYFSARLFRRLHPSVGRAVVITIGFGMTAVFFLR